MRQENILGILMLLFVLSVVATVILKPDHSTPASEWSDVFDVNCGCGQHIHAEPYDKNYFYIECITCGKVYEKNWDFPQFRKG